MSFEHSTDKFNRNTVFISSIQNKSSKFSLYPFQKTTRIMILLKTCTMWKVSKYRVFYGAYFYVFGLNKVFIPNAGKYGPEKTPYFDFFTQWLLGKVRDIF